MAEQIDIVERIKSWREDDEQGYDTAIALVCEAEETIIALRVQLAEAERERDEARVLLLELVTLVRGECSSVLNEDSGGDAALSMKIDAALWPAANRAAVI